MSNEPTSRDIRDLTRAINDHTKELKEHRKPRARIVNYGPVDINQMVTALHEAMPMEVRMSTDDFVRRTAENLIQKGWTKRA